MAVAIFLFAMFLLWRNHHRTVTVTRELADSAVILAEELNLLIDGAQDYAIYMLAPDGNVPIWKEGAQRLKGWTDRNGGVKGKRVSEGVDLGGRGLFNRKSRKKVYET